MHFWVTKEQNGRNIGGRVRQNNERLHFSAPSIFCQNFRLCIPEEKSGRNMGGRNIIKGLIFPSPCFCEKQKPVAAGQGTGESGGRR